MGLAGRNWIGRRRSKPKKLNKIKGCLTGATPPEPLLNMPNIAKFKPVLDLDEDGSDDPHRLAELVRSLSPEEKRVWDASSQVGKKWLGEHITPAFLEYLEPEHTAPIPLMAFCERKASEITKLERFDKGEWHETFKVAMTHFGLAWILKRECKDELAAWRYVSDHRPEVLDFYHNKLTLKQQLDYRTPRTIEKLHRIAVRSPGTHSPASQAAGKAIVQTQELILQKVIDDLTREKADLEQRDAALEQENDALKQANADWECRCVALEQEVVMLKARRCPHCGAKL
jgi:hypothetical protein